ncbi:MAG TPA: hypothetical protein PLD20_16605 [Blastocatellia bacterium]|nr:hypothetical protein [Blastocatellia bacterium]HMV84060.1 hypothetical protein [Blastocatellia bacterium]HMX26540.1 hypothetical protein [Blastocatellia bacterium]HMY72624.1 hypothetical protein [Blastocatellia bacterium]HMZ19559.1 hypothetical protein [Blastocatellia bacterium]
MKVLQPCMRFLVRLGFDAPGLLAINLILISLAGSLTVVAQKSAEPVATKSVAAAKETFDRLKKLEGKWTGRSTKGWTEAITFKTIAQGSVVHESSFDAHPNETMATMYYLDGERLLLTHYCVSKTQPRLQATAFENDGRKVTFTFLDGGNLSSRDKGHMDKVVLNFVDDDHFTSQWTWYQQGKEQWLEEIKYERTK